MAGGLFKTKHENRVNSPEQLNDYIRIARPGIWLILIAALVLLISVFVWAVFGSLESYTQAKGLADGSTVLCYMADTGSVQCGNEATVNGIKGTVTAVSEKPVSREYVLSTVSAEEYDLYLLAPSDWSYVVEITLESETESGFASASIMTEAVSPISFIWD